MRPLNDLTPTEFEIWVRQYLETEGGNLECFKTEHLEKIKGTDGDYIFDITAKFKALGLDVVCVIECKRYSRPIERDEIQILKSKKDSTGADIAIAVSTSGFQKGAIEFAKAHRIRLISFESGNPNILIKSGIFNFNFKTLVSDEHFSTQAGSSRDFKTLTEGNMSDSDNFIYTINKQRLDYLIVLKSRGYDITDEDIASCIHSIQELRKKYSISSVLHISSLEGYFLD